MIAMNKGTGFLAILGLILYAIYAFFAEIIKGAIGGPRGRR